MRVVHVSSFDQLGGAARAAYRLHEGLRRIGVESRMFVADKLSRDDAVIRYEPPADPWSRVRREIRRQRLARSLNGYRPTSAATLRSFSDDRAVYQDDPWSHLPECDVLHLHWVAGFVDYEAFFAALPAGKSVVWTLHDMNPFTGGCHYDEGCGRFSAACGACPQLDSKDERDLSHQIWQRKRKAIGRASARRLHIVGDSEWLASEARRSSAFAGLPVTAIHYGLDVEAFAPRERLAARSVLGIPMDAQVVLFGADHIEIKRKGLAFLLEALTGLPDDAAPFLVTMGNGAPPVPERFPHLHLGYVTGDRFLSIVYSAADVFVIPSLQEAFGQTALESMACGTPVVGFDAGGIREVVVDRVTGLLAPVRDSAALGQAVGRILSNASLRAKLGSNGRKMAVEQFSLEIQAKRYVELYQQLLPQRL